MSKAKNPLWTGKSRQRKAILNAAQDAGLTVMGLTWTPISAAYEMCGVSGGWQLDTKEHSIIPAYSAAEMVAGIQKGYRTGTKAVENQSVGSKITVREHKLRKCTLLDDCPIHGHLYIALTTH